jgi:hypothetical protein
MAELWKKVILGLSGSYVQKTGCERLKEGSLKCKGFIAGKSGDCRAV